MRIFISGPVTKDPLLGTRRAILAASQLADAGITPFVPHLYTLWEMISPRPYEDWMSFCFNWLTACQAVLRLPGESSGADREVELAKSLGMPVFTTVEELLRWAKQQ